jgi:hypothetical protein
MIVFAEGIDVTLYFYSEAHLFLHAGTDLVLAAKCRR